MWSLFVLVALAVGCSGQVGCSIDIRRISVDAVIAVDTRSAASTIRGGFSGVFRRVEKEQLLLRSSIHRIFRCLREEHDSFKPIFAILH